jgi:hypothetical protein
MRSSAGEWPSLNCASKFLATWQLGFKRLKSSNPLCTLERQSTLWASVSVRLRVGYCRSRAREKASASSARLRLGLFRARAGEGGIRITRGQIGQIRLRMSFAKILAAARFKAKLIKCEPINSWPPSSHLSFPPNSNISTSGGSYRCPFQGI